MGTQKRAAAGVGDPSHSEISAFWFIDKFTGRFPVTMQNVDTGSPWFFFFIPDKKIRWKEIDGLLEMLAELGARYAECLLMGIYVCMCLCMYSVCLCAPMYVCCCCVCVCFYGFVCMLFCVYVCFYGFVCMLFCVCVCVFLMLLQVQTTNYLSVFGFRLF